ncbi:5-oxoprolinase subunit C family protein [Anaerosporobacter sp.]
MGIRIIKPGLMTTIQDGGRTGFQDQGIPVAGAMDLKSMRLANILLANKQSEAVIECTILGPDLEFLSDCLFAITGANMQPTINEQSIPLYHVILGKKGDILRMNMALDGVRSYLAFAGGLDIASVLGSKSTDLRCKIGGYEGRCLQTEDTIDFLKPTSHLVNMYKRYEDIQLLYREEITVRVLLGPQDEHFTEKGIETFLSTPYEIMQESNRMGYRLQGEAIEYQESVDIISDGITFGSIQIPSNGMPIIMMADHQTTGGYAKIATVVSVDLPLLAQHKIGSRIRFEAITLKEAQKLARKQEIEIKGFRHLTN